MFTSESATRVGKEVLEALKGYIESNNMVIDIHKCKYGPHHLNVTLNITEKEHASELGVGKQFTDSMGTYIIRSIKRIDGRTKFPVLAEDVKSKKIYKFPISVIDRATDVPPTEGN